MSCPLHARLRSDQLTAMDFIWEKEGRRRKEMVEHKLNKQTNLCSLLQPKTRFSMICSFYLPVWGVFVWGGLIFFLKPYSIIRMVRETVTLHSGLFWMKMLINERKSNSEHQYHSFLVPDSQLVYLVSPIVCQGWPKTIRNSHNCSQA